MEPFIFYHERSRRTMINEVFAQVVRGKNQGESGAGLDNFPARLQALRREMKPERSLRTVSELMGLSPDALRRYERGEVRPGMDSLKLISEYYGVSADYLLGRTDDRR